MPAKSMDLASGTLKSGDYAGSSTVLFPGDQNVHLLISVPEMKGAGATYKAALEWSHDGEHFVPADPPDEMSIASAGGAVKHFTYKAPYFRVNETVAGSRASVTRNIHIQYNS